MVFMEYYPILFYKLRLLPYLFYGIVFLVCFRRGIIVGLVVLHVPFYVSCVLVAPCVAFLSGWF